MKSLIGIGQFPSLGGLFLSYNDLNWREINRLHHMHILRLTLIGNPQLDCDPNCKNTYISCTHTIVLMYHRSLPCHQYVTTCLDVRWIVNYRLVVTMAIVSSMIVMASQLGKDQR